MRQIEFDDILMRTSDEDILDLRTLHGTPITADFIRQFGRLESIGDGRYLVLMNSDPANPRYAARIPMTDFGPGEIEAYVLDFNRDFTGTPLAQRLDTETRLLPTGP